MITGTDNLHLTGTYIIEEIFYRKGPVSVAELDDLRMFLEDLSDLPEQYRAGFKTAAAMINFEPLPEHPAGENPEKLFSFIRDTLLVAVKWSEAFAVTSDIAPIELLRPGLGRGFFAIQCTGTRNFSYVEWQVKQGIRAFINKKKNKGKKTKIQQKTVSRKPVKCPFCGSSDIKKIVYGMPGLDFDYAKYVSGGCCIMPDSPQWRCDNCCAKFRKNNGKEKKI